ncbi:MAG: hypothetical protein J4G15_09025 [Alphaproteobacteria bacterium]|nr:hypothetical protein [Alphaproteobacteria bacterium]
MAYAGCAAYLIRASVAADLLDRCFEINIPIDVFLYDLRVSWVARELRPLVVVPSLVQQANDEFESDINPWRKAVQRKGFVHRRLRDVRVTPYRMWPQVQRLIGCAKMVPVAFQDRVLPAD